MRILYLAATGPADPTRASIPLHLAANGSGDVGHETQVVLAGDATELLQSGVRDELEGVGIPPLRDLMTKLAEHEIPVFV